MFNSSHSTRSAKSTLTLAVPARSGAHARLAVAVIVGAIITTVTVLPTRPAAASTQWSIVPSANLIIENVLSSVSCSSSSSCMAVGYAQENGTNNLEAFAESWDGTLWSIVPAPNPAGSDNTQLDGVSCTSPTFCMAVGFSSPDGANLQALAESWDGNAWTIVPNTTSLDNGLTGVSCTSPTSCVAVGWNETGQRLAESWNGTTWSLMPTPDTGLSSTLSDVSCTSPTFCIAVGSYDYEARILVESWDGTAWSITPSPSPGSENQLTSVSCTSSTSCMAIGDNIVPPNSNYASFQTLAESWDGTTWSIVPSPDSAAGDDPMESVSCTDATSCIAVGFSIDGNNLQTLIESWDGSEWSIVPSPNSATGTYGVNVLNGVSCMTSTTCLAAGYSLYGIPGSSVQTLVETGFAPSADTTTSLPDGTDGHAYSTTLATGGVNPPCRWSVVSGTLPRGLHLNKSRGLISGKINRKDRGTFTFTVQVVGKRIKIKHHPVTRNTATKVLRLTIS